MVKNEKKDNKAYLEECRKGLEEAEASGDSKRVALAKAYLGYAFFAVKKYADGMTYLDEAITVAETLDKDLHVHCLGIKSVAFQIAHRYPDAYETVNQILEIAEKTNNPGVKCDALVSQGHILLESGEPVLAHERVKQGLDIARELEDKKRMMNALGVLSNLSISVTSTEQAEKYLHEALALADELGDEEARHGYLGNLGIILVWQERYHEAEEVFEQVLAYLDSKENLKAKAQALRHLAQINLRLKNPQKAYQFAKQGLEVAKDADRETAFQFYQIIIQACYQLDDFEEGDAYTAEAVELARKTGDDDKTLEFALSLGESYFLQGKVQHALETYTQALHLAQSSNRRGEEAYLTGRLGIVLAEAGQLEEAIEHHLKAVTLAHEANLPEIEGEQMSMLAIAHRDLGNVEEAVKWCSSAVGVFRKAKMDAQEEQTMKLLEQLQTRLTVET